MDFLLFANSGNQELARELLVQLQMIPGFKGTQLGETKLSFHADGEPFVEIYDNVRRRQCIVLGCIAGNGSRSVNDYAMETFVLLDALNRADANVDVLLLPYFPYARQDRRKGEKTDRTAISAVLFVALLKVAAPIGRVCAVEPHDAHIEGSFFRPSFDRVPVIHLFAEHVKWLCPDTDSIVVVSPDRGGWERASALASAIGTPRPIAWVDKRRPAPGEVKVHQLIGDVKDMDVVIVDDMIDTAGSLVKAAEVLTEQGAKKIVACAVHGLFNRDAIKRIEHSRIERVIVTNSVEQKPAAISCRKIRVIPIGELLAQAVRILETGESLRSLGKK